VETLNGQMIASVTIRDLSQADEFGDLHHAPVMLDVLESSCPKPASTQIAEPPHFQDGYSQWRAEYDAGRAGVWTLAIDQIHDITVTQLRQLQGAQPLPPEQVS
jgi:hypothetical protein